MYWILPKIRYWGWVWCTMEWLCSGWSIWPRPHHNSAGSRSQKYALNFGHSQIIYHPGSALHMPTPCVFFVSYHTIAICTHIPISFKLSKSIIDAQMQRKNPFPHDHIEICEAVDKYFSHGIREIRLSLKPPSLNELFWLTDPPTPPPNPTPTSMWKIR